MDSFCGAGALEPEPGRPILFFKKRICGVQEESERIQTFGGFPCGSEKILRTLQKRQYLPREVFESRRKDTMLVKKKDAASARGSAFGGAPSCNVAEDEGVR